MVINVGDTSHPLHIPITADPVIGNQKIHNMKKLLIIFAAIVLAFSCEKENNPKSQTTVLDTLIETAASTNDDGSYNLEMTMSGGGYTVKLTVPSPEMKLKAGTYEVKAGGCSVSFNDGYVERKVSSGKVEIAADNNAYTINMSVISRNEEYKFKFQGAVEFKSFVGTVIRNRSVNSAQMKREMKYSIYLPKDYGNGESFPVLYLLHGYGDENNAWLDKGNLAKIAKDYEDRGGKQMIVVCPDALTTFYFDSYQTKYKTYFFEELVPAIEKEYKVKTDKYSRSVAGLSMGGYGTLYYGLGEPDKFCYAYACSAACDMGAGYPSLYDLAKSADPSKLPGITLEMGTEDWVTGNGADFHNALTAAGIQHEYIARSGVHDWNFWQECLPKVLKRCGESYRD